MIALVARGHGNAIVPASARRLGARGVAFRELDESEPTTIDLHAAWPRRPTNPALHHALTVIKELNRHPTAASGSGDWRRPAGWGSLAARTV